ncbi:MAG: PD40 domain-containing protein [Gemmatimonadetes bacterium]|nr:PD40 domain-containing protein [Gemmatimonadota bacterium]
MIDLLERLKTALAERYLIERELGQGGMATVYLAHDLKHGRQVAVKVLRPELAAVIGAERFLQEIRVTAHLQHPHILALFDSGEADRFLFYVMPYLEGESLRDRLAREKQLPVDEAVEITRAVAGALDYAHCHKVIHRDIKPENILLHDGQPVVADFGIALAVRAAGGTRITESGLSLGTPQYMSPEQATADRELDGRTDIYSLGCVLYEMLVGEPPHTGPTVQSVIAKVLTDEPRRLRLARGAIPSHVEAAAHKALAKLPADRFNSAQQFAQALTRPAGEPAGPAGPSMPGWVVQLSGVATWVAHHRSTVGLGAALGLAVLGAAWGWLRPADHRSTQVARFELALPAGDRIAPWPGTNIALSPDGTYLVYAGEEGTSGLRQLFLRALDQFEPRAIPGTRGGARPFFSPDGQWLGFYGDGSLRKVAIAGGPPITIAAVPEPSGAAWGPDDQIVFAGRFGLSRVAASGGVAPEVIVAADSGQTLGRPELLPGGRAALVTIRPRLIGTLSDAQIGVASLETGRLTPLGLAGTNPHYLPPGFIVYGTVEQSLLAVPFDLKRLRVTGPLVAMLEGVTVKTGGAAELALSGSGNLVYLRGSARDRLVLVDRRGNVTPLTEELRGYGSPRFSPDGRSVAVRITDSGSEDIWIYGVESGTLSRITFEGNATYPAWFPDGKRVAFSSARDGRRSLYWRPADGSADAQVLVAVDRNELWETVWSPDGRMLAIRGRNPNTRMDLWTAQLEAGQVPQPLLETPFMESSPALSPDGRWLAYVSDESGQPQIYVRPFPGSGGRWQVSTEGGQEPIWARSGRELLYRGAEGIVSVRVGTSPAFSVEGREVLFPDPLLRLAFHANWDVHPDGQRFLMRAPAGESRPTPATVVVNWMAGLKK